MKNFIFAFICLLLAVPCQARTIYVDVDATSGNNGSSWAEAFNYLADAIAEAISSYDVNEIRVAQGVYKPDRNSADPNGSGDREAAFYLINKVTIKGGFAGFGQPNPDARNIELYETILSGDLMDNDDPCVPVENMLDDPCRADNCYHLFYHPSGADLNATAILDGFTITAGNANDSGQHRHGGGMYNYNSSPMLTNCVFSGNSAVRGGGMWNDNSSPTITNCTFSDNSAGGYGGGMYNYYSSPMITNCTYSNNSAKSNGGGMYTNHSNPTVTNCTFSGNSAEHYGGGMHNRNDSSPIITNCIISSNSADDGGGIYCFKSSPTITNCTIIGNLSDMWGGGICCEYESSPVITNCTFIRNSTVLGGGISCDNSSLKITNCTFSGNFALWGGGMYNSQSSPTVSNCTFIGNSADSCGGGISNSQNSSSIITNCTFSGNYADFGGGGIYNEYDSSPTVTNCNFSSNSAIAGGGMCNLDESSPTLTNCTFSGNSALNGNACACDSFGQNYPSDVEMKNCILWDGGQEIWNNDGSTIMITYSNIQGSYSGMGNIDAYPCFVNPDSNDFHLLPNSPCTNTGDPNYIPEPNETDLEGLPRVIGGRIDMGAYESNYIEATMKFTPPNLNCKSKGKFVKAHITLPEGFTPEDVALDTPALAYPMNLESEYLEVFLNDYGSVELEITFDRRAFCDSLTETGQAEVTVIGSLTTGQYFYGNGIITAKIQR